MPPHVQPGKLERSVLTIVYSLLAGTQMYRLTVKLIRLSHTNFTCCIIQPCCGDVTDGSAAMRFQNSRSLLLWTWESLSESLAIG